MRYTHKLDDFAYPAESYIQGWSQPESFCPKCCASKDRAFHEGQKRKKNGQSIHLGSQTLFEVDFLKYRKVPKV